MAAQRARFLSAQADKLFEVIAQDPSLSRADIDRLVRRWLRTQLDEAEQVYATAGRKTLDVVEARRTLGQDLEKSFHSDLVTNNLSQVEKTADRLLREEGATVAKDGQVYQLLCRGLLRASAEFVRIVGARLEGRYDYTPSDPLFTNLDGSIAESEEQGPPAPASPPLSQLIARHLQSSERKWDEQTTSQNRATLRMLSEWSGDPLSEKIDRKLVSGFLEALAGLPARYGQIRAYRGRTLPEAVKIARIRKDDGAQLTQKTLNRHASALSGLFTWAKKHGLWKGENPAAGFIDKRSTGKGPTRRPWREEELERLFSAPPWRGCKSASQRLVPGKLVVRDGAFYVPLLCLFMGLRMEEACKLTADDVRVTDGIPVIDVVGTEEGRVKEEASNRVVPIHPEILKIGFLNHVAKIRSGRGGHLWPELTRGGAGKSYSHNFSKWFSRLKANIGLTDSKVVFHSFRKNVATALHGAGIPESVAADILGHEHKSMSYRVYSTGAAVRPLYEAICKIEHGVSLLHLHQPAEL